MCCRGLFAFGLVYRDATLYCTVPPTGDDALGRADLHLHTRASDGLMSARDLVDYVEHHTDLDVIAITDHDETSARSRRASGRPAAATACRSSRESR